MIDLWYIHTKDVAPDTIEPIVNALPARMANEIMRFRNHEDRRLKLFGRMIVKKYHEQFYENFSWSNWSVSDQGKPFYQSGKKFNISHSGDIVAVAFSESEVGIDIEECAQVDIESITDFLHEDEKGYIKKSGNSPDAFYNVWTRKEAYLKAKGVGIVEGLNNENCLKDNLGRDNEWFLTSLSEIINYKLAVCTRMSKPIINTLKLDTSKFLQL